MKESVAGASGVNPNRALVVKLGVIALLALALILPLGMVDALVAERRGLRDGVLEDVARSGTGAQRLDGLVLVLPCTDHYEEKETLDKAEVAEVFEPLRLRPARPAWTGSPDRNPSPVPPVQVPKAVANGSAPEPEAEGGLILTPPNEDGDSFGESPNPGNV